MDRRPTFAKLPAPLVICIVALGYFVAARLGLALSLPGTNASPVWPPSGLALAAAWLVGRSALPGVFLGAFGANLSVLAGAETVHGTAAVLTSIAIAAGNTAEAWLATLISKRFNARGRLDTLASIFGFLAAALAASTVAASSGTAALWAGGAFPPDVARVVWLTWWLGDATGMVVVTPLLLALARSPWSIDIRAINWRGLAASAALLAAAGWATFGADWPGHLHRLAAFSLVAYVAWHAMRWSFRACAAAILAVAAVSVAGTMAGRGPFVQAQVNDSLIALDGFLLLCSVTGLVLLRTTRGAVHRQLSGWRQGASLSLALLLSIACTLVAWHVISRSAEDRSDELFAAQADRLVNVIREHMHTQEQALRGARGLMDASVEIDALQWKRYVRSLDLPTAFPGVQGVGFATATPQNDALDTEIILLEPMDDRNRRAVGFDMYSEPVRRQAMQRARDLDEPALSGKVILKQEDGRDVQAGVLMYLPVFDHPPRGARRLRGYVYSAFRMNDLLTAALRGQPLDGVSLSVFDGSEVGAETRLFSTSATGESSGGAVTRTADIAGRRWTVQFTSAERAVDNQKAQITLIAGSIISLLLFSVLSGMAHTRQEALELAERMSRRRAEAERRFQSLAESASDSILILDSGGRISFCNQAAGHMFGCAPAEVQERGLSELVDLPPGFGAWLKCLARGIPCGVFTTQANGPSGKVDIEVSMGAWLADGQPFASLILHDISARTAAERHLAQARSDIQAVVDNMPAKVASWDKALRNRFCNRDYGDWFGARPSDLIGRSMESILEPADLAQALPYVAGVLQGQPQSFERQAHRPDGSPCHLQVYYVPDVKSGEVEGFFSLTFDITGLKQTEKALRHGLRLHDVIFAHAGVGIACTRERRFERVSRRCTELFGYGDGELDDQPARVVYPDDEAYALISRIAADTLPAGRTLDHELFLRRKDGSQVWCRLMARAVDPNDPSQGTIWIIDDFGDRKQQQDLLESARQSAEAAARLKSQFLANMSHEIRTPMNAIIGMTRMTLDGPLDDAQRDNLQMVEDAANSLLRLLNDILDLSKMEAGKFDLLPAAFDVRDQLATTLQQLAPQAEAKGLELILTVDPAVPAVATADAGRLMQVVTNLCSNAIKFTERGRVECQVSCSMATPAGSGHAELRIAVVDTGIGMSPESLERVFQAFEQADGSIARRFGGTGLGLSICSQLVSLMGGRLSAQSTPGLGTHFEATARIEHVVPAPSWNSGESRLPPSLKVATLLQDARATASLHALLASWGVNAVDATSSNLPDGPGVVWLADAAQWAALPEAAREAPTRVALLGGASAPRGGVAMLRKPIRHGALRKWLANAVGGRREPAASTGANTVGVPDRPLRVLVVDDHPANQKLAAMVLERRGHRVVLAGDGAQAVTTALAGDFDAILMDLHMPGVDGETAMRAIRSREQALERRTPIIALTANAMAGERERLLAAGMDGYLSKPFRPEALLDLVESVSKVATEAI